MRWQRCCPVPGDSGVLRRSGYSSSLNSCTHTHIERLSDLIHVRPHPGGLSSLDMCARIFAALQIMLQARGPLAQRAGWCVRMPCNWSAAAPEANGRTGWRQQGLQHLPLYSYRKAVGVSPAVVVEAKEVAARLASRVLPVAGPPDGQPVVEGARLQVVHHRLIPPHPVGKGDGQPAARNTMLAGRGKGHKDGHEWLGQQRPAHGLPRHLPASSTARWPLKWCLRQGAQKWP